MDIKNFNFDDKSLELINDIIQEDKKFITLIHKLENSKNEIDDMYFIKKLLKQEIKK